MIGQKEFLNSIISDLKKGDLILPTLPEVALQVRNTVNDPNATASQLADIIVTDAALSARLLKVANSPLYRGNSTIDSIQMAVSRLGLKMVRNIVTSLIMEQMFQPKSKVLEKRLRDLWELSTQVSAAAQVIASNHGKSIKKDEAMLAGLIHAIGVLPILMKAEETPEMFEREKALDHIIQNLHPHIGKAILEKWEFSPELVAVAAEHTNLKRNSAEIDLVDIVQVAVIQNLTDTDKALPPDEIDKIPAFKKLGIETGIVVVELDENSEEYAEALKLFNM
jgi:HD-like signal output (HDOD) protein